MIKEIPQGIWDRKTELVVGGVAGYALKGSARFALAGLGVSGVGGTVVLGAFVGGLTGMTKEYFKQAEEVGTGAPVTSIQERITRRLIVDRSINADQARRIGIAFIKGAAVGAIGAVVGAELHGITDHIGNHFPVIDGLGEAKTNFKNWAGDKMSGLGSNVRYFPLVDTAISIKEHPDLMARRAPGIGFIMDRFQGEVPTTIPHHIPPTPVPQVGTDHVQFNEYKFDKPDPLFGDYSSLEGKGSWDVADYILARDYHVQGLDYFSADRITTGPFEGMLPAEVFSKYVETSSDYQPLLNKWMETTMNSNDLSMFELPKLQPGQPLQSVLDHVQISHTAANADHFRIPNAQELFNQYFNNLSVKPDYQPIIPQSPTTANPTLQAIYSGHEGLADWWANWWKKYLAEQAKKNSWRLQSAIA